MILFNHYVLFYLKSMDMLNILTMVVKICHLLRMMKKFTINTVAKLKIFNKVNRTTFTNDFIPFERHHYNCIPLIDIDSVLKIDKAYPQEYLEQCKYKLKKRRVVNFIDNEIIDDEVSDIDDYEVTIEERQKNNR